MAETARPVALARAAWCAAVATAAATARAKLPALVDAIDLAEQLTLAPDGGAVPGWQRHRREPDHRWSALHGPRVALFLPAWDLCPRRPL